jgi:hypothetical protein
MLAIAVQTQALSQAQDDRLLILDSIETIAIGTNWL